ncbi:MAG: phosphoribosylformylglycinamidine synthase subunit PurL [Verrucomicrobiota bacterium]
MREAVLERKTYREIAIRHLDGDALSQLSLDMKLSLSREDMEAVRGYFTGIDRDPTDVELEVIAQTWSEHCKHRIFGARIRHTVDGEEAEVDGLFRTYIKGVTERIRAAKPGFVVAAFDDNAGFIKLDEELAICLKVETHNHPSAIEPYAGANTGLGGVIRDILGAGKGAKPVASSDVFCFGSPDTDGAAIKADDVIHPLGVMRGVVRGVRDYGNRMGIPTVNGAIQFDPAYIYNPLVFCGTAGVIPIPDIHKEMVAGLKVVAAGGRTGRDGLHGATFSSAALDTESHEEDQQAVQIGNPIEEKKVADFVLAAREAGLLEFVTDCGAGGFSSAAGEMLSEVGGELYLERVPLKEPGLVSWEIFVSESQERMVMAVKDEALPELEKLATIYETELTILGHADGSGILKVWHDGKLVCELDCGRLHEAPRREMVSRWEKRSVADVDVPEVGAGEALRAVFADFAIVSREPIIREYDHEVQGNTFLKPLGGATGDAPQDGAVVGVNGSDNLMALGLSLLPEWGKTDPYAMGAACVDECFRQLVCCGADPERIALLDNFCVGNPDNEEELGALVECIKGMAAVAEAYGAPFVSGKDSFYNYFETDQGPVSIPVTALISGMGVVPGKSLVTGASLRREDSVLGIFGATHGVLGGSVFARVHEIEGAAVPVTDCAVGLAGYQALHGVIRDGLVLSAHDLSEGGLAVAAAEMGFSGVAGMELDLGHLPGEWDTGLSVLFSEESGRVLLEMAPGDVDQVEARFAGLPYATIGRASDEHGDLVLRLGGGEVLRESLEELKGIWKNGLTRYY